MTRMNGNALRIWIFAGFNSTILVAWKKRANLRCYDKQGMQCFSASSTMVACWIVKKSSRIRQLQQWTLWIQISLPRNLRKWTSPYIAAILRKTPIRQRRKKTWTRKCRTVEGFRSKSEGWNETCAVKRFSLVTADWNSIQPSGDVVEFWKSIFCGQWMRLIAELIDTVVSGWYWYRVGGRWVRCVRRVQRASARSMETPAHSTQGEKCIR